MDGTGRTVRYRSDFRTCPSLDDDNDDMNSLTSSTLRKGVPLGQNI